MKKLVNSITYFLVFIGIFSLLSTAWKDLEIAIHGFSQESTVDTIIAVLVSIVITVLLDIWKAIVDNS